MEKQKTHRGFDYSGFSDMYGAKCSIQKSSLATDDAIWFGVDVLSQRLQALAKLQEVSDE